MQWGVYEFGCTNPIGYKNSHVATRGVCTHGVSFDPTEFERIRGVALADLELARF